MKKRNIKQVGILFISILITLCILFGTTITLLSSLKPYTPSVSTSINEKIDLEVDQSDFYTTKIQQSITGTLNPESDITSVKCIVSTDTKTERKNVAVKDGTWEADLKLVPGDNTITVTADTNNGQIEEKTITINYDAGSVYTLDESHIKTDEETGITYIDNIIIIIFNNDVSDNRIHEIISSINGEIVGSLNAINQYQVQIDRMELADLESLQDELEEYEEIRVTMYDTASPYEKDSIPNDPWFGEDLSWDEDNFSEGQNQAFRISKIASAWEYNDYFSPIDIGIIDSGVDTEHEDLKDKNIKFPASQITKYNIPDEHGTAVAGIIAAKENNHVGMAGICWNSNLLCFDDESTPPEVVSPQFTNETIKYAGLYACVISGAKIINLSQGRSAYLNIGEGKPSYDKSWIQKHGRTASIYMSVLLENYGDFLVVQSAGNGDNKEIGLDAINNGFFCSITEENCYSTEKVSKQDILDRVIVVGAARCKDNKNPQFEMEDYSNGNDQVVDIIAPGSVYTTVPKVDNYNPNNPIPNGYSAMRGTSLAAPIVTGIAGLVWSIKGNNFTGADVRNIVCNSYDENIWVENNKASPLATGRFRMVNAKLAVEEAIRRVQLEKEYNINIKFNANSAQLFVDGILADPIINKSGLYLNNSIKTKETRVFTFVPNYEYIEFRSPTVTGLDDPNRFVFDTNRSTLTLSNVTSDVDIEIDFDIVNKSTLNIVISMAENKIDSDEFKHASQKAQENFIKAYENAKTVYKSKIVTQEEVDIAWANLLETFHHLSETDNFVIIQ